MEEGERLRIFSPRRVTLIRSGVDLAKMRGADSARAEALRAEYALPGGKVMTLVGRLSPPKTPEVFVDAAALVVAEFPETRLLLVGDGAKRDAVEAQIARLNLERNVLLLGLRTDVPEIVAASDVVVHSSTHEGLPKTVLEGIAAHIHLAPAGKNGPPIIPLEQTSPGVWSVPEGSTLTDEQYAAFKDGELYVNVHSAAHKPGEIRAQLKPKS